MTKKRHLIKKGQDPAVDAIMNQYNAKAYKEPDGSITVEYPDGVKVKWRDG